MNVQTENGYTRIANELYEAILRQSLSGYEMRVLHTIIRKTYGYGKKEDFIALSQIADMTKIKKTHVSRTVANLVKYEVVTKLGNKLRLNKNYLAWKVTKIGNAKKALNLLPKSVKGVTKIGNEKLPKSALQKKKENITKENIYKYIGEGSPKQEKKTYGHTEIDAILNDFKKLTGHIPADDQPRRVAQNMKQIVETFIKTNKEVFAELRGSELTKEYVFEKFYLNFEQKKYSKDVEKLKTIKLKLRVYLDDVAEKLEKEKKGAENANYQTN